MFMILKKIIITESVEIKTIQGKTKGENNSKYIVTEI